MMDIDVTSGTIANGLEITFTGDQYTFLENFRLDGNPVTAVLSGNKVWTVTLTDTVFSASARHLNFDAYSNRFGSRNISTAFQYPAASNCVSGAGPSFTITYPPVTGIPVMTLTPAPYRKKTASLTNDVISSYYDLPMNGTTPFYVCIPFKNNAASGASTDAYDIFCNFSPNRDHEQVYGYAFVDPEDVWYSIDGAALKKVSRYSIIKTLQNNTYRRIKPANIGKCADIGVYVDDDIVPVGSTITFYFAVYDGATYDHTNYRENTGYIANRFPLFPNWAHYRATVKNANGEDGTAPGGGNYQGFNVFAPAFMNDGLGALSLRPNARGEVSFALSPGTTATEGLSVAQTTDIYVKLPAWMELDGDISSALKINGANATPVSSGNPSTNTYFIRIRPVSDRTDNRTFTLKYKTVAAGGAYTVNRQDTIEYWLDWNLGHTTAVTDNALRPTLQRIGQRFQQANFLVEENGIVLDTLYFHRSTKGLKDTNNNGIPDDGSIVSDADIDHYRYRQSDEGEMVIIGRIAGSTADRDYFYLTVNSELSLASNYMALQNARLEKGNYTNGTFTMTETIAGSITPVRYDDNRYYLKHQTGNSWNNDNYFRLTIPFKMGLLGSPSFANYSRSTVIESYLSNADIPTAEAVYDPVTAEYARYGKDNLSKTISITIAYLYALDQVNRTLTSMDPVSFEALHFYDPYSSYGSWTNEYRPAVQPKRFRLQCPPGYVFANNGTVTLRDTMVSYLYNEDISVAPTTITPLGNGGTEYEYKFPDLFGASFTDANLSTSTDGKWILYGRSYSYYYYVTIQPTREAPSTATNVASWVYSDNLMTGATDVTTIGANRNLMLNMSTLNLLCPTTSLTAYGRRLTIPSISVGSANTASNMRVWLYVAGNVSNISGKHQGNLSTVVGSGYEGRWIELGMLMPEVASTYELSFDYGGASNCSADNITVYTVSGFEDMGWPPITGAAIVIPDYEHNGPKKQISILVSEARIDGSLSVPPETTVIYGQPYTLTATLDASASPGILKDAEMIITIPAGQEYVAGTARIEYPTGTFTEVDAIEAALLNGNNSLSSAHSFTFNATQAVGISDFFFDGYQATSIDPTRRQVTLTAQFKPQCDTDIKGIRYSATLSGKNACGQNAIDNGKTVYSDWMLTGISTTFAFTSATSLLGGNNSFGGNNTTGTLQITVTKTYGAAQTPVPGKDYAEILFPQWLVVDGPIQVASIGLDLTGSVLDTIHIDGGIRIELPVNALNVANDNGINLPFTYSIPVRYIASMENELIENPVQTISSGVYTVSTFGSGCLISYPFPLGNSSELKVALLTLKTSNPYLYNMASIGEPFEAQVTSKDFAGGWYADESLSTELLLPGGTTYTHPSRQTADTVMVYIKADFGQSYGNIPVTFRTPPVNLAWRTDAPDSVWINPANWTTNLGAAEDEKGYLPALSTVVTLPSGVSTQYPFLSDTVACRIIRFEHGAELGRQDLLVYDSARVQLKIATNQWYMFSPPLHNMYSGDFYREYPDPYVDEQTAYTVRFSLANPETGFDQTGSWTGAFNTPNVELGIGSGLAIWIDKHGTAAGQHPEISFDFPKHDTEHHLYNPDRYPPGNISETYAINRDKNGHFVYEGKLDASGNVTLPVSGVDVGGSVLIGNPFMAHLNFSEFYESNKQILSSRGYKSVHGAGSDISTFYSYAWNESANKYVSTSPEGESNGLIPPMQSFIVEVNNATGLQANIYNHTTTSVDPEDAFRNAETDASPSSRQLNILAARNTEAGTEVSRAIVLQGTSHSTHYVPSEDSYKLFVSKVYDSDDVLKHVQVYTRSSDGYALDINFIGTGEQDITIPLCIRTSEKGEIKLNFSGMESFGEETGIYLYDTQYPKRLIDLSTQPEYVFDKTEDELYLENRLSLVIGKALTQPLGVETVSESSAVRILSLSPRRLKIVSESGKALGNVRITDAWGRVVLDDSAVSSSTYEYQTPAPGVYVVRVGAAVKKAVSIR
jgi:hypothetical protein